MGSSPSSSSPFSFFPASPSNFPHCFLTMANVLRKACTALLSLSEVCSLVPCCLLQGWACPLPDCLTALAKFGLALPILSPTAFFPHLAQQSVWIDHVSLKEHHLHVHDLPPA